jgi:hypothetical protein
VVAELGTNLLRHAEPGGWLLIRPLPPAAVEIIAVDRGPGVADVAAAVEGRAPDPKGLGRGLAAVRRAAARFDIHSRPGRGTAVLAVTPLGTTGPAAAEEPPPDPDRPTHRVAGVSLGITEVCGDGWAATDVEGRLAVAVVDGLGHGVGAALATDAALRAFSAAPLDVEGFVVRGNDAMRDTRGAAAAVCVLDPARARLHYVVVGNITGRAVVAGQPRGLLSQHGTLGIRAAAPKTRVNELPWPSGSCLVLWTDGLTSRVDLAREPDLLRHDPAVVAAVLHRDHARERDDATVVVAYHPDRVKP